jgi:hypothetical protein
VLIEIKAGHIDRDWPLTNAHNQITRYAKLAPTSGYPISSVAIYLARYGLLLSWPNQGES